MQMFTCSLVFSRCHSSKQTRSFSWSTQQLIHPGVEYRVHSNSFGCSASDAFVPKLNPSNSFIPSETPINSWFTYMITLPQVMVNLMKALMVLLQLIQKCCIPFQYQLKLFQFFFSSCIGNFHLNILLILGGLNVILGVFSGCFNSDLMSVPP